ncbi:hypothetical protein [Pseudarthrobacter scleromae]|uniref:hypothetical protein n=1 Tax=Pseudarthrobacter scleromae TaxID=158897 RepID=UPI003D00A8BA
MDFAWLKDFGGFIKDLATVILPIIGVTVGAKLTRRSADDQWLKKERLAAYLDLIDQLGEMLKHFAVGMRMNKFGRHDESEDHNADSIEAEWHDRMDALERAEVRVKILGGQLGTVYNRTANGLISEMLDAIDDPDITDTQWRALSMRGHSLRSALEDSAKIDLEVPVLRTRRILFRRKATA